MHFILILVNTPKRIEICLQNANFESFKILELNPNPLPS